jgi:hypothetical protein
MGRILPLTTARKRTSTRIGSQRSFPAVHEGRISTVWRQAPKRTSLGPSSHQLRDGLVAGGRIKVARG